jgi:hypothetical protein
MSSSSPEEDKVSHAAEVATSHSRKRKKRKKRSWLNHQTINIQTQLETPHLVLVENSFYFLLLLPRA